MLNADVSYSWERTGEAGKKPDIACEHEPTFLYSAEVLITCRNHSDSLQDRNWLQEGIVQWEFICQSPRSLLMSLGALLAHSHYQHVYLYSPDKLSLFARFPGQPWICKRPERCFCVKIAAGGGLWYTGSPDLKGKTLQGWTWWVILCIIMGNSCCKNTLCRFKPCTCTTVKWMKTP